MHRKELKQLIGFGIAIAAAWILRRAILYALSIITGGVLLAFLIHPLAKRLERHMNSGAALILAWMAAFLLLGSLLGLLVPLLVSQVQALCGVWPEICRQFTSMMPEIDSGMITGLSKGILQAASLLRSGIGTLTDCLSRFGMMWLISIFLYRDKGRYLLMAELLIPQKYRANTLRINRRILRELKLFFVSQAMVALWVALLSAVGLSIIRVRGAALLGLITGALNLIPYIGPLIAALPVGLTALCDGWLKAVNAVGVLITVQQIDSCLISPKLLSGATGLSPLSVILSLAAGGAAFGLKGIVIAIPAAIVCRILFSEWAQSRR